MASVDRASRMTPQRRREQIMDSATQLILAEGVARCGLEAVAAHAKISKALIYRYFRSREALLEAILDREYAILFSRRITPPDGQGTYEEILAAGNRNIFGYLYERGPVLRVMFSDRAIARLLGQRDKQLRADLTLYYAEQVAKTFAIPHDVALLGTLLTINAPLGAARAMKRLNLSPEEVAEFWTTFMIGGWIASSSHWRANAGGI